MKNDEMSPDEREAEDKFQEEMEQFRVPLSCPACDVLLYNWDDQWWYKRGVCSSCAIEFLEDRDFEPEFLLNRRAVLAHCKKQVKIKNKI